MKHNFKCATLVLLGCLYLAADVYSQKCTVTFQADFNGVDVKDRATIGLRGGRAPLDWNKTMPMRATTSPGIYTLTVDFPNCKPGETVAYKFIHDTDGWENNDLGQFGDRSVSLVECAQKVPVQKFDQLDRISNDVLLMQADRGEFQNAIFTIAMGKKRGLNPDAIAKEMYDFWKGERNWLQRPQDWMNSAKFGQAGSPNGKFEELENTDGKVRYKVSKKWDAYFGDSADVKGVTKAEMGQVWKKYNELIAAEKGWTLNWKEGADAVEVSISAATSKD